MENQLENYVVPKDMAFATATRVVDTRLEQVEENQVSFVCKEGAQVVSYVPITSSSHSNTSTVFNLNNIANKTCRDKRMELSIKPVFTLSVTNNNAVDTNVINSDNFGWKQYPLNRCMSSVQHQINQASNTFNSNELIDALARVKLLPEECNFYDNSAPDFIASYQKATGSTLNPLADYASSVSDNGASYKPRSLGYTVSNNSIAPGATEVVVISGNLYEPLITPFNNIGEADERGMYAINGELISIQWVNDLFNNMCAFVLPGGLVLNSVTASLGTQATLNCVYLTPDERVMMEVPQQSIYHYNQFDQFTNTLGACPAGSSLTNVSSQVVNFTNVPDKILIYARPSNGSRTTATPDRYLTIQNLTCVLDNGQPQLTNASTNQLWNISRKNGLTMPRPCFRGDQLNYSSSFGLKLFGCGSVLVLDPAMDLGLAPGLTNGSPGRKIFQVQNATFVNNSDDDLSSVTLYVVGVSNAILERMGTEYRNYLLSIPENVVEDARKMPAISYYNYLQARNQNMFLSGGSIKSFFKHLWSGIKSAGRWIWKNRKPIMDVGKTVAPLVGLGEQEYKPVKKFNQTRRVDLFYS